jgi:hypothetical protein
MPKMAITEHAVERFVDRVAPEWGYVKARHYLEEHAEQATRLPDKTLLGQRQYEIADPPCILVVKGEDEGTLVCVTVFPRHGPMGGRRLTELEAEMMRELAERPKPQSVIVPPAKKHWAAAELRAFLKLQRDRFEWEKEALQESMRVERSRLLRDRAHDVRKSATLHRKAVVSAQVRHDDRMARHIETQDAQISKLRRCLRPALQYVVQRSGEDGAAAEVLDAVRAAEPGFLTEGFLSPKQKPGSAA